VPLRTHYNAIKGSSAIRDLVNRSRHIGVRQSDAFIASYPRSGNTWVKLVLIHVLTGKPSALEMQDEIVPYVGNHRSAPAILPNGGRLIKTHEPFKPSYGGAYRNGVYIVRDGRDVAVSYYYYSLRRRWFDGSFSDFLPRFLAGRIGVYGSWHEHVLSWSRNAQGKNDRMPIVRYEDLVARPIDTFSEVLRGIGANPTNTILPEAVEHHSFDNLRNLEASTQHLSQSGGAVDAGQLRFFRSGAPGAWHSTFADRDAREFDAVAGAVLRQFGYEPST